jgi:hypothetical protein
MDASSDIRPKRKNPPTSIERPKKQMRPDRESSPPSNGSTAHANGGDHSYEAMDEPLPLARQPTTAETAEWQATIEKVVKNVVAIHMCLTCSFDTETATASEATGFVVDAERGYILTNRVCPNLQLPLKCVANFFLPSTLSDPVRSGAIAFSTTMKSAMYTPFTATRSMISESSNSIPKT